MIKRKIVQTEYYYDDSGKTERKVVTETDELDSNRYGLLGAENTNSGIARFGPVSHDKFINSSGLDHAAAEDAFTQVRMPTRSTTGSAGYDFVSPISFTLNPGETIKIPTGVRVCIDDGWFLCCVPRSGLGFKYRLQLDNTVGIIDSDYYFSDNEGHIILKMTNALQDGGAALEVRSGDRIAQGIFMRYGTTQDDNATGSRNGGFGSTDKIKNE